MHEDIFLLLRLGKGSTSMEVYLQHVKKFLSYYSCMFPIASSGLLTTGLAIVSQIQPKRDCFGSPVSPKDSSKDLSAYARDILVITDFL